MNDAVENILIQHTADFHPVVRFDPATQKIVGLNLSGSNHELTEEVYCNTQLFSEWISKYLSMHRATYAIGGYNENRKIYSRSKVFDAAQGDEEPRRLHLGIDIWGRSNTPVIAPLNGIVHSFAFNNNYGDYGVTIILSHYLAGSSFYTLYGHLSLNSIKNLQEGSLIKKGDVFAELGMQFENGQWPPHLHFQIIKDMEGNKGDYPGVCKLSEQSKYLSNCPNPDLIIQLNHFIS